MIFLSTLSLSKVLSDWSANIPTTLFRGLYLQPLITDFPQLERIVDSSTKKRLNVIIKKDKPFLFYTQLHFEWIKRHHHLYVVYDIQTHGNKSYLSIVISFNQVSIKAKIVKSWWILVW